MKRLQRSFPYTLLLLFAAINPLFMGSMSAQSADAGVVEGRISNSAAGNYLKQVRVTVEGTALEAYTDEAGWARRVPHFHSKHGGPSGPALPALA